MSGVAGKQKFQAMAEASMARHVSCGESGGANALLVIGRPVGAVRENWRRSYPGFV